MRRVIAVVVSAVLMTSTADTLIAPLAVAETGPTVPLPPTPSVPSTPQNMQSRPPDQASSRELHGDQPSGSAKQEGSSAPTATSLSPSATWNVSAQTGDFTWSYPLRVPPAPGGQQPQLALSYSSSSVDGRTSATNNQPSWIGDGWDLNVGFVERSYGSCAEDKDGDVTPPKTGDLCWKSDNATAAYGSGGGMLVRDSATGVWRPKNDDGARVEKLTGANNGAHDGEYWKITTIDGTQYFYGSRPDARSAWTVPVFGDDSGEPCHGTSFDASSCTQAWRWNLDKVVDRHGNTMIYSYDTETNSYGRNLKDAAVSYIRGGTLRKIEYGLHDNPASGASGQVEFLTADRCVPGSACTLDKKDNWPDTALDERCDTATCKDHYLPTFWSTKRLAKVVTRVWTGSQFTDVDAWTLDQQFPDPGDGDKAALWLKSVTHSAGTITLPPVTFEGAKLPNRVVRVDGVSPLIRFRVTGIVSESGGVTSINYAPTECATQPANPATNTERCFPVNWTPKKLAPRMDYFHKYVVASVGTSDRIAANPAQQTNYEYLDGAAWHFDTSEFSEPDKKTWNEFRGFGRVRVHKGSPNDPGGPITMSEDRFYRGMNGDHLPTGTREVSVTDSEGGSRLDEDWLQGFSLESATFNGEAGPVVSKTITDPVWQGPTATRGVYKSYIVKAGAQRELTAMDAGGLRTTRSETTYDDRGLPTQVNDLGDLAVPSDDKCTRTTYVRNTTNWLLTMPSRVETVSVNCATTPKFPDNALSDQLSSYDGQAWNVPPTHGDLTKADGLDQHPAAGPVYVTVATAKYDAHGRATEATDAIGRTTKTSYTPALGGPDTQTVVTNAVGHVDTVVLDPAFGLPRLRTDANQRVTETAFDSMGRATEMWLPNRPRSANSASYRFSYLVRNDGPTAITTSKMGPNGNYVNAITLYDGLFRVRQTQSPAVGGGRLLTDTRYDSQGRVLSSTKPYFNDAPMDTMLWVASDTEIPGLTVTEYDGVGRPVAEIAKGGGTEMWRTTTTYGDNWVHVTPPAGATPTTTITDAHDRIVELRQHQSADTYNSTTYTYNAADQLASLRDPAGNTWTYGYDVQNRLIRTVDPDRGTTTSEYDLAGQLKSQTDARGQVVVYDYDDLGRKLSIRADNPAGRLLAQWTYDTALAGKGQPATSTSFDSNGKPYVSQVLGYNALYQPLKTSVIIPETEGRLAGTYTSTTKYNFDGSLASETFPAIGDLPDETLNHTYDDFGRALRTYGGPAGSTVEYATQTDYTRYGELQRVQLGDPGKRAWLSFYYDDHTRQLRRSIVDAEVPRPMQNDTHYTYDPAGNVTSIADTPQDQPADTQCFRYDYLRRLTEAWTPGGDCAANPSTNALAGPAPYWQSFTYDAVGNRQTGTKHSAAGDTTSRLTYTSAHTLDSVTTSGPGGTKTENYQYNAIGDTTASGTQTMIWDAQGHLSQLTEPGKTTRYEYEAGGQRIIRRDSTGTTLSLSGQELRLSGTSLTATRYYTHGGAGIAVRTAAGLTWLAADPHGTGQVAINSATMTASIRRSDPFGNPRGAQPDAWPGERGFVSGTMDPTGLTHLGAREYDPETGRFISPDPIVDPKDPQQLNAYAYANSNPTSMSDPSGLKYYIDADGLVSVPSLRNPEVIEKASQKSAAIYRYRDEQKKRLKRAQLHDWDGMNGKRGHVGEYGAQQVHAAMTGLVSEVQKGGITDDLKKRMEDAATALKMAMGDGSVSICAEAFAGVGPASVGGEACANVDSRGVALSGSFKYGVTYGIEAYVALVIKVNPTTDAASQNRDQVAMEMSNALEGLKGTNFAKVAEELEEIAKSSHLKVGWFIGAEIVGDPKSGTMSLAMKVGYGGGLSLGGAYATHGFNTGYLDFRKLIPHLEPPWRWFGI